jgi:diguanylate cyclase (GGDEF)-like protein
MKEKIKILSSFFEIVILKTNTDGDILETVLNTKENLKIKKFKSIYDLFSPKEKYRLKRLLVAGYDIRKKFLKLKKTVGFNEFVDIEINEYKGEKYLCIQFFHSQQKKEADYDRNVEKLAVLSSKDPMTDILNRAGFIEEFRELISRSDKKKRIGIIFLDMDGLKTINDNHGHNAGDQAILNVTEILKKIVRQRDLVARLGGDEFVIVVEEVTGSRSTSMGLAKRILKTLGENKKRNADIYTTASVGIHVFEAGAIPKKVMEDHSTFTKECFQQLDYADKAAHEAKQNGKNQIAVTKNYKKFY